MKFCLSEGLSDSRFLRNSIRGPGRVPARAWILPGRGRRDAARISGTRLAQTKQILADARTLRAAMPPEQVKLILDDRVDLVETTAFDGVHRRCGRYGARCEPDGSSGPTEIIGTFGGSDALLPGILDGTCRLFRDRSGLSYEDQADREARQLASKAFGGCANKPAPASF